ncbi:uncharacterized protein LOC120123192 [Hibiscus syriacus]|nr:uncharacterized protein LOC120123192 [Hibiscus syriacus]
MERLSYSFSPTPLQISRKPSPFTYRLANSDSPKLSFAPSLARPQLRRVRSISCKTNDPSQFSRVQYNASYELSSIVSPLAGTGNGSKLGSNILKLIAMGASSKRKAITDWAMSVALYAVIMFLIQPIFAPTAFATFQIAAKTSGTAARGRLIYVKLLSSEWTGFFSGCFHTLSGPDHLMALAPLSIGRTRMGNAVVGALWGFGMMLVR